MRYQKVGGTFWYEGNFLRFLGGLLLIIFTSKALALETVKVRLSTTTFPQIKVYENLNLTSVYDIKEIKEPIEIKSENLSINSASVPPHVILTPDGLGSIDIIAVLDMEDYLRGVLPHEMPLVWPIEALKAQVVVARSFARKQISARKNNYFHLESTVTDQMYRYNSTLTPKEKENLEKAIEETKDEVLINSSGQTVKVSYHADCGGQTEKASQVWGQKEVEFSVKDSKCPSTSYSQWETKITAQELKEKLKMPYLPKTLSITAQTLSQRAIQMEVVGLNPQNREKMSSQEFRRLVGYKKLKSTKFEVQKINEGFLFKGSGYGHGVGLCQWGAKAWAQSGLKYTEILKHYFPTYTISKLP